MNRFNLGDTVFYAHKSGICGLGDRVHGPLKVMGIRAFDNAAYVYYELDGTTFNVNFIKRGDEAKSEDCIFATRQGAEQSLGLGPQPVPPPPISAYMAAAKEAEDKYQNILGDVRQAYIVVYDLLKKYI